MLLHRSPAALHFGCLTILHTATHVLPLLKWKCKTSLRSSCFQSSGGFFLRLKSQNFVSAMKRLLLSMQTLCGTRTGLLSDPYMCHASGSPKGLCSLLIPWSRSVFPNICTTISFLSFWDLCYFVMKGFPAIQPKIATLFLSLSQTSPCVMFCPALKSPI